MIEIQNKLKFLALALIISLGCNGQELQENFLVKNGFRGSIRNIKTYDLLNAGCFKNIEHGIRKGKECSKKKSGYEEHVFNKKGELIEFSIYETQENVYIDKVEVYKSYSWVIDDKGNEIEHEYFLGEKLKEKTYKHDDKGNIIEETKYNKFGGVSEWKTWKFDNDKNIIERCVYSYDSDPFGLLEKYTFKYDTIGNIIEMWKWDYYSYDENGEEKFTYEYDDKGKLTVINKLDSDDSIAEIRTKKYDNKENVIKEFINYTDNSIEEQITRKYDDRGNEIEVCISVDKNIVSKYTWEYDDKEYLIEESVYSPDVGWDYKKSYKYIFDDNDNWIRIVIRNGEELSLRERIINYFDE